MASTQLKRKARRNRAKAKLRVETIKRLSRTPVIKNVDIEKIKEEFSNLKSSASSKVAAAPVKEEPVKKAETAVPKAEQAIESDKLTTEKTVDAPAGEKKEATKPATPAKAKATQKVEASADKKAESKAKATPKAQAAPKTKASAKSTKPAGDKAKEGE